MLYLEKTAFTVASHKINPIDENAFLNISKAQAKVYSRIYGLSNIPIYKDGTLVDFILESATKVLSNFDAKKIGMLVYPHTIPFLNPINQNTLKIVQRKLQLDHAICFGMTLNNCVGSITAIEIIHRFLSQYKNQSALMLMGEIAYHTSCRIIKNSSITGDASAAAIFNTEKGDKLILCLTKTYGQYAEVFKTNGASPQSVIDFEQNYVLLLIQLIQEILNISKLKMEQIKLILPHNVNLISWNSVIDKMGIEPGKIYTKNISQHAHCFGADIFINYQSAVNEEILQPGDYYLMVNVGLGAYFSAVLFQYQVR